MLLVRSKRKQVKIGNVIIGGGQPITVQSMLSLEPKDIAGNIAQALELESAGCEILRVAVPGLDGIKLIKELKQVLTIPLVADIHFDYKLAIMSVEAGVDKLRINPGNIGDKQRIKAVADIAKERKIPIRIGVNSGSLEKHILSKYKSPTPEALVESALYHASLLEEFNFSDIVLSMKATDVITMMDAYQIARERCDYPLHLGITHSGTFRMGTIKSAIGIGGMLARGIGDTFRVSLTAPPVEEIILGKEILSALGMGNGVNIIACPTCGRCTTDVFELTKLVDDAFSRYEKPITIAVMGCIVNGPGEAKEADIGVTGIGNDKCIIFSKGKPVREVETKDVIHELMIEANKTSINS